MSLLCSLSLSHSGWTLCPCIYPEIKPDYASHSKTTHGILLMICNDYTLNNLAEQGLVQPYNKRHLQPCSIDLTLGQHLKVENPSSADAVWMDVQLDGTYFSLSPGEFILAHTEETVKIPEDCCGDLVLRSSAARAGFDHCLSGLCDPGFEGQLTLELRNNLRNHHLKIEAGMRICQLVIYKLDYPAETPYALRGSYQNQMGATASNNRLGALIRS